MFACTFNKKSSLLNNTSQSSTSSGSTRSSIDSNGIFNADYVIIDNLDVKNIGISGTIITN